MKTKKELNQIQKGLVGQRFNSIGHLNLYLSEELETNISLKNYENPYTTGYDYALRYILSYDNYRDLNIIIFYLKDRKNNLFITEAYLMVNKKH